MGILGLAMTFNEALTAVCSDSDTPFELDEDAAMVLNLLFSSITEENDPAFRRAVFDNAGVRDSDGLLLMFLEQMGVRRAEVRNAMTQAEGEVNAWVREVSDED